MVFGILEILEMVLGILEMVLGILGMFFELFEWRAAFSKAGVNSSGNAVVELGQAMKSSGNSVFELSTL